MTQLDKDIILSALALKEASIKRAEKAATAPRFKEVYAAELADLNNARSEVMKIKIG